MECNGTLVQTLKTMIHYIYMMSALCVNVWQGGVMGQLASLGRDKLSTGGDKMHSLTYSGFTLQALFNDLAGHKLYTCTLLFIL